jgi:hypothetical protein
MDITGSWHPAGEGLPWISPLVKDTYSDYQKVSYDVDIPEGIDYLLIPTIWYEKSEAASEAGNYYRAVSMGGIRRTQTFSLSKGLNKPNPLTLNVSSLSGKQTLTFEWKKQPAASSDVKIIIKRIFFKEIASGEGSLKSSR